MNALRCLPGVALAIWLSVAAPAAARDGDDPVRTLYDIELKDDPRIATGKSAFLKGTATPYGHQFQVEGTQLEQPISVGLYAADPSRPLRMRVVKDSFGEPVREVQTDARGRVEQHFRTYDGFRLWVSAAEPSDYQLVVWVGEEIVETPPPAVLPASEYVPDPDAAGTAEPAWKKHAAVGFLLLALVFVVLFVLRRRAMSRGIA